MPRESPRCRRSSCGHAALPASMPRPTASAGLGWENVEETQKQWVRHAARCYESDGQNAPIPSFSLQFYHLLCLGDTPAIQARLCAAV